MVSKGMKCLEMKSGTFVNSASPPRGGVNGRKINRFCLVLAKIVFDLAVQCKIYQAKYGMKHKACHAWYMSAEATTNCQSMSEQ